MALLLAASGRILGASALLTAPALLRAVIAPPRAALLTASEAAKCRTGRRVMAASARPRITAVRPVAIRQLPIPGRKVARCGMQTHTAAVDLTRHVDFLRQGYLTLGPCRLAS